MKYEFKVSVELEDDLGFYSPKSLGDIKEWIKDAIFVCEPADVRPFKNVMVEEMPLDILNTPMVDVKPERIEKDDES